MINNDFYFSVSNVTRQLKLFSYFSAAHLFDVLKLCKLIYNVSLITVLCNATPQETLNMKVLKSYQGFWKDCFCLCLNKKK